MDSVLTPRHGTSEPGQVSSSFADLEQAFGALNSATFDFRASAATPDGMVPPASATPTSILSPHGEPSPNGASPTSDTGSHPLDSRTTHKPAPGDGDLIAEPPGAYSFASGFAAATTETCGPSVSGMADGPNDSDFEALPI